MQKTIDATIIMREKKFNLKKKKRIALSGLSGSSMVCECWNHGSKTKAENGGNP